eukprot:1674064-Alexandrium_andersonii.AAC.1
MRCRCKVKTAIVPSDRLHERQAAEQAGLFGRDAAVAAAPYLGATVTSPAGDELLHRGSWSPEAVRAAK